MEVIASDHQAVNGICTASESELLHVESSGRGSQAPGSSSQAATQASQAEGSQAAGKRLSKLEKAQALKVLCEEGWMMQLSTGKYTLGVRHHRSLLLTLPCLEAWRIADERSSADAGLWQETLKKLSRAVATPRYSLL